MNATPSRNKSSIAMLALTVAAFSAALVGASSSAYAVDQTVCVPALVETSNENGATVIIQCPSPVRNFYGQSAPAACGSPLLTDTVKAMTSIAQSAILAGKSVRLYSNLCAANNRTYLVAVDLIR